VTYQSIDRAMVVTNMGADGEERLGKERIWADWVVAARGGRRRGTGRGGSGSSIKGVGAFFHGLSLRR